MKLSIVAIGAALSMLASTDAPAAPSLITQPDWIARPSGEAFGQAYPELALAFEIGGKAIIRCKVDAAGMLQACAIEAETPEGFGFGAAAMSMTSAFQIRPKALNGQFVEGGEVRIPLRFVPQRQAEPAPNPPSTSTPRALQLARQLVALSSGADAAAAMIEDTASQLEAGGAVVPAFGRLGAALRASYPPRAAQARESSATRVAETFDEGELTQLVGYFSSRAGAALLEVADQDREMSKSFEAVFAQTSTNRARQHFCASAECIEPGAAPFPSGAPGVSNLVAEPVWSQRPSQEIVAQLLPPAAKILRVAGAARLSCVVSPLGAMDDCVVANEAPKGLGVARSAMSLSRYYRLDSAQVAAGASGSRVTIDVWFPAAPEQVVGTPPKIEARSSQAMSLARKLTVAQDAGGAFQSAMRGWMDDQREVATNSGMTQSEFDRLGEALRAGAEAGFEQGQEIRAAYMTTRMSDQDMLAALHFWEGPTGRAWKTKSAEILARSARAGAIFGRLVMADAGRAFCKISDCDGVTLQQESDVADGQPMAASPEPSTRKP